MAAWQEEDADVFCLADLADPLIFDLMVFVFQICNTRTNQN